MKSKLNRGYRLIVVLIALVAVALAFGSLMFGSSDGIDEYGLVAWVISASILGGYIELRTSGNRMARILLAAGVLGSVAAISDVFMPAEDVIALTIGEAIWTGLGTLSFFAFLWSTYGLLPMLFPTGRPLSRRWAWATWIGIGAMLAAIPAALFTAQHCVSTEDTGCLRWVDNPIGISWMPHPEYSTFGDVFFALVLGSIVIGLISFVVRFFRSRGIERQQMKWLLAILMLNVLWILIDDILLVEVLGMPETTGPFVNLMEALSWASIAIGIGLAILRYRLYEIDRIISRTVSYALLVGLLLAALAGISTLAGSQFDEPWVVAATTLGVAAAFNPLRTRVQSWVDRRFNRSRFDAEHVMDEFASSLRDRVDPEGVVNGWVGVVTETMQPAARGLWVRN
jgi:hypothetical protein